MIDLIRIDNLIEIKTEIVLYIYQHSYIFI